MFDTGGMGFRTRRCRGPSWSGGCPTAARPGAPTWNAGGDSPAWSPQAPALRARRRRRAAGGRRALRRAALPLQLQLPRRRLPPRGAGRGGGPARASRPWPSPTTTASTAWSASPRRPGRSACPRCSAPSSPSASTRPPSRAAPIPTGDHLLVLADDPDGLRPPGPGHQPGARWRGRRARPALALAELADGGRRGHWLVLTGCRKGAVPAALVEPTARPRPARELHRLVEAVRARPTWPSSCGTTATRSTRPATTPWPSWPSAPGSTCVATNNVHYATPARRPLATALAAVRARRSLDEIDGWLPAGGRRPPALGGRAGPPLRPLPRRGRAGGRARPRAAPSTSRSSRPTCRRSRAPTATTR